MGLQPEADPNPTAEDEEIPSPTSSSTAEDEEALSPSSSSSSWSPSSSSSSSSSLSSATTSSWNLKKQTLVQDLARKLINANDDGGSLEAKIQAARDIRKLAKASVKTRSIFASSDVFHPLISMLLSLNLDAREASLLALLNLAVRNERNKIRIVTSGAVPPLVELLEDESGNLRDLATAAILTLSAAASNKPTIAASGAIPLLVQILSTGSVQGKVDAVTALYNLSTAMDDPATVLSARAVPPLLSLLKECKKKYSKFAEKTTALLEILSGSEDGRIAISDVERGILTVVETVEDGSPVSTEHAVGVLLSLCQSCRKKYRELILKEGAIPGLLKLTVEGTPKAQERARTLLDLLRESPPRRLPSAVLETIVYDIATRVDGADRAAETAKRLWKEMVQRSMELSMTRMQVRAASSVPSKLQSGGVQQV